jgi:hypothetical protein
MPSSTMHCHGHAAMEIIIIIRVSEVVSHTGTCFFKDLDTIGFFPSGENGIELNKCLRALKVLV